MSSSIRDVLVDMLFLCPMDLQRIYSEFPDNAPSTVRARIYEGLGVVFVRVKSGVYASTKGEEFDLILADCPWSYSNSGVNGAAGKHYSTMSLSDLRDLPVGSVSRRKTALAMWATSPLLPEALDVMRSWGFEFKTVLFVWIKQNSDGTPFMGTGFYTRQNAEFCLLGVREETPVVVDRGVHQVILSPRQQHSRKPAETYARLEKLFGDVRRLELFARERRRGWDAFGNEVPTLVQEVL